MPLQTFAPMRKDFPTFDCDAHVTEPPLIWERAKDHLTRDELDALKATIWWDADGQQLLVNGKAGVGLGSPRRGGIPGTMRVISNAGPGVKHDIQRALNVRNLDAKTASISASSAGESSQPSAPRFSSTSSGRRKPTSDVAMSGWAVVQRSASCGSVLPRRAAMPRSSSAAARFLGK